MAAESLDRELDMNLPQLISGIGRKWYIFAGIFGLSTALSLLAYLNQTDSYTSEAKILVKPSQTSSLSGLNQPGLEDIGDIKSLGKTSDPVVTESEVLRSNPLAEKTIKALRLQDEDGAPLKLKDFSEKLVVKEIPGTDMLRVSYESENPVEAANVVNQLISLYMQNNVLDNREETSAARVFLEQQLPKTELAVRTIESELRAFREKNKVLALKQQTDALVQNIDRVDTEIDNARIQLNEVSQQIKTLQGQLGMTSKTAAEATSLSSSTMVQQLLTELQSVQRELDQARSRFQETHPIVQGLRDQERALQNRLQTSSGQISPALSATSLKNLQLSALDQQLTAELVKLEVEQAGLLTRVDGLSQVRQQQVGQSQSIPLLEQTQRALERRLDAAQTTYSLVLQRLQEIQIAENQTIGNVRVIAQATLPDKPDSTDKKLLLLGGLALGLLGGTAAALFADLLDGSVKTAEEAADLLGYGLLGVIPSGRSSSGPAQLRPFELDSSSDQHALQISSAYSNLQANVRLLSATQEPKTLMITASSRREGTSGVVANFAASIADSSSKVLIIDANLESSAQAEIWQCSNANGLLDVLSSRASLHAAIQDITPFLSVLPMNRLNQRPLTMLDFKKIEVIVHDLRKQFDFIVIDAPCLSDSVDASVLGTLVDGILVVVKPQVAKKKDILAARRRLEHADRKVLGVVANELKVSDPRSSVSLYSPASNHPIFIQ